ncbi:MAG: YciI family protein [Thermomicrobiales bacterium]
MAEFMLLIRGGDDDTGTLSPEAAQQRIQKYVDWSRTLRDRGQNVGANELEAEGLLLRSRAGEIIVDGPFTEIKEGIGGYFHIRAASQDEAVDIAAECPVLDFGGAVEIRAIVQHS